MKILLLEDGYPAGLLEGFEVERAPQEDVVAVLTNDERVDAELMDRLPSLRDGVRVVELDELLAGCDAVTLHLPLTRETRNLAPRLVLTPHAAWYSGAAEERSYRLAVARVRELLAA